MAKELVSLLAQHPREVARVEQEIPYETQYLVDTVTAYAYARTGHSNLAAILRGERDLLTPEMQALTPEELDQLMGILMNSSYLISPTRHIKEAGGMPHVMVTTPELRALIEGDDNELLQLFTDLETAIYEHQLLDYEDREPIKEVSLESLKTLARKSSRFYLALLDQMQYGYPRKQIPGASEFSDLTFETQEVLLAQAEAKLAQKLSPEEDEPSTL